MSYLKLVGSECLSYAENKSYWSKLHHFFFTFLPSSPRLKD